MINIVFSDSACGSLKMAQHYGEGEYSMGVGVIISCANGSKPTKEEIETAQREAEEKDRLAWESATPLGGNSADVFGFNLVLSVGDISEAIPGSKRQEVLDWLWSIYPDMEEEEVADSLLEPVRRTLETIFTRAAAGEDLRLWYSNGPDDICGMYWFMAQLLQAKKHSGQIFLVKLPEWETDGDGDIIQKSSWGEVAPYEWGRYISLQKPAPPAFCRSCVERWHVLQEENAPLRAVMNGRLESAPKTLYDSFITREIAAEGEEFQEAMIIGRVLGKYRLGIGDAWVALRIEEMIKSGILKPESEPDADMPIYHRMLRKCVEV